MGGGCWAAPTLGAAPRVCKGSRPRTRGAGWARGPSPPWLPSAPSSFPARASPSAEGQVHVPLQDPNAPGVPRAAGDWRLEDSSPRHVAIPGTRVPAAHLVPPLAVPHQQCSRAWTPWSEGGRPTPRAPAPPQRQPALRVRRRVWVRTRAPTTGYRSATETREALSFTTTWTQEARGVRERNASRPRLVCDLPPHTRRE